MLSCDLQRHLLISQCSVTNVVKTNYWHYPLWFYTSFFHGYSHFSCQKQKRLINVNEIPHFKMVKKRNDLQCGPNKRVPGGKLGPEK